MSRSKASEQARWRRATWRRVVPAPERLEDRTLLSLVFAASKHTAFVTTRAAGDIHLGYHELGGSSRAVHPMAEAASGSSIKHSITVGALAAGRTQTFSGAVTKHKPTAFYQLRGGPQEAVQAALSVQKGAAKFTMLNSTQHVIASLTLSGNGTHNWTFGASTYYVEVSATGKSTANYKLSFSAIAHTAISLDASPRPSVFGQTVTLTASVRALAPATSPPGGSITFMDSSSTLGTSTLLASGMATWSTSSLSVGTHAITAIYHGNGDFNASTSSALSQVVNQASSATNVAVNVNPAVYGQALTFTVTVSAVSPGSGVPTGMVTLAAVGQDGSSWTGTGSLDHTGTASFTPPVLGSGSYSIAAAYLGDSNFQPSVSATTTTTVRPAGTRVLLTSSPSLDGSPLPTVFGQAVTFTASVSAVAPGSGIPTGTVTFMDGSNLLGTDTVDGTGTATFATSALGAGTHTITAIYDGSGNFATSTSSALSQVVKQASSATNVTVNVNPGEYGQALTFAVTVSALAPGSGIPTGVVTFSAIAHGGSSWTSTGSLDDTGTASFTPPVLGVGPYSITAAYLGDSNFQPSVSATTITTVKPAATTLLLTSSLSRDGSPLPSVFGQAVTFTALVSPVAPGSGIPTGTVTFMDGSNPLGTDTVNGTGTAMWTTSALGAGTHAITAIYGGDGNFSTSTSPTVSQVVSQASSATNVTVNVNPGGGRALTFTVAVSAVAPGAGIPTGMVTFSAVAQDGSSWTSTGPLDDTGTASFTPPVLAAGSYSAVATYLGDSNFQPSISATTMTTVSPAQTTVQLTPSVNPVAYQDQSVTFTATVSPVAAGAGTPTGSIQFQVDGANFGAPVALINGSATSGLDSTLKLGGHTITATYIPGSGNFQGSTAPSLALNVELTQQQIAQNLQNQIQTWVNNFDNDAVSIEFLRSFYGLPTLDWYYIKPLLAAVVANAFVGDYPQAFQLIVQPGGLADELLAEAATVKARALNGQMALLECSWDGRSILQDLETLGAYKEITYGFLVYLAAFVHSPAMSSPSYLTEGVLGTGDSGGLLMPNDQSILNSYSTADIGQVTTAMGNIDPDYGTLGSSDNYMVIAQETDGNGSYLSGAPSYLGGTLGTVTDGSDDG